MPKTATTLPYHTPYDIFLSHAFCNQTLIKEARDQIMNEGYTVYLDWIDDANLDREKADEKTAEVLRQRLRHCSTLIYPVSGRAAASRWMQWELGYADAQMGRVFVYPLDEGAKDWVEKAGELEFLRLYQVVDTKDLRGFLRRHVPKARDESLGPRALDATAARADRVTAGKHDQST